MGLAIVNGIDIAYEIVGDEGEPWIITCGGRYSKESPGMHELADALAAEGKQVVLWDRPNVGSSGVCFDGDNESQMQADALAGLLETLELPPAIIAGGSGGARVSLLAAARHREVAKGLAVWWMSGGVLGLLTLGVFYCRDSIKAAWNGGMEAVIELPEWQEVLERNPANRQRFLDQDPKEFIRTLESWMLTYCPCGGELIPGLPDDEARAFDLPTLIFRSGESDPNHTRATSEALAALLPNAELVEPPWGDTEWIDRQAARSRGEGGIFSGWYQLVPQLVEWAGSALGRPDSTRR